ncbi:putative entry exclusion protein TrbK-alt [Acinetobacter baumannii]
MRQCNAMGEAATRNPICHAAWAEKRRRFLGAKPEASSSAGQPSTTPSGPAEPRSTEGQ